MLIPRMGRRADVVLISSKNILFVLEFKVGAKDYHAGDLRQAIGYALDLHHFTKASNDKCIVPILVATHAKAKSDELKCGADAVYEPLRANQTNLFAIIEECTRHITNPPRIDVGEWLYASYKTNTDDYRSGAGAVCNHDVSDIARNDAGAQNLNLTQVHWKRSFIRPVCISAKLFASSLAYRERAKP